MSLDKTTRQRSDLLEKSSLVSSKYSSPVIPCAGYELCCIESLSGMNVSVVIYLMIPFPFLRLLAGVLNFLRTFCK